MTSDFPSRRNSLPPVHTGRASIDAERDAARLEQARAKPLPPSRPESPTDDRFDPLATRSSKAKSMSPSRARLDRRSSDLSAKGSEPERSGASRVPGAAVPTGPDDGGAALAASYDFERPVTVADGLLSSILGKSTHVSIPKPSSDAPQTRAIHTLSACLENIHQALGAPEEAGPGLLPNQQKRWATAWNKSVEALKKKPSAAEQAMELAQLVSHELDKLKPLANDAKRKNFLKRLERAVNQKFEHMTGDYLNAPDALEFLIRSTPGLALKKLKARAITINQKCREAPDKAPMLEGLLQKLLQDGGGPLWDRFEIASRLARSDFSWESNADTGLRLREEAFAKAVAAAADILQLPLFADPTLEVDATSSVSDKVARKVRDQAENAEVPPNTLDAEGIASTLDEIMQMAGKQVNDVRLSFMSMSAASGSRRHEVPMPLKKLTEASNQLSELVAFVEAFPAQKDELEQQLELRQRVLDKKTSVDALASVLHDYLQAHPVDPAPPLETVGSVEPTEATETAVATEAAQSAETAETDSAAEATQTAETIDSTGPAGTGQSPTPAHPAQDSGKPEAATGPAETPVAPVPVDTPVVSVPTETAVAPVSTDTAVATVPIDTPTERPAIKPFDADRFSSAAQRRSWFSGTLASLPALVRGPGRPAGSMGSQEVGDLTRGSEKLVDQAKALKDGYRAEVTSARRVEAVENELLKLMEAADSAVQAIKAIDRFDGAHFAAANRNGCVRDLVFCLSRASALEALLERAVVLQIPFQDKIEEAFDPRLNKNPPRIPQNGIEVVPTSTAPMIKIKLYHPPADGRKWLEAQGMDAGLLEVGIEGVRVSKWSQVEPDFWSIHAHTRPGWFRNPQDVNPLQIARSGGEGIDLASCKLGDFERAEGGLDIGRGLLSEDSPQGLRRSFVARFILDNPSKIKPV